jgi:hypothetical protein
MHEVSIMAQILEIATENARQQDAKKIHQLKGRIGASQLFLSHWYSYLIWQDRNAIAGKYSSIIVVGWGASADGLSDEGDAGSPSESSSWRFPARRNCRHLAFEVT